MFRQYRKLRNFTKKIKRNTAKYLKKHIPLVKWFSEWRKKFWSWKYSSFSGIDEKLVVFTSNEGRDFSGTPAQIYEQMTTNEAYQDYKFAWLFNDKGQFKHLNKNRNTRIYSSGSKKGIRISSQAHFFITNSELSSYRKIRKHQILFFDPEEYFGAYLYLSQNKNKNLELFNEKIPVKALSKASYITSSNINNSQRLTEICNKCGNHKVKITEFPSYLTNLAVENLNQTDIKSFRLPIDKRKIWISFNHGLEYTADSLLKLDPICEKQNCTLIFNKFPIIEEDVAIDAENLMKKPRALSRKEIYPLIDMVVTDKFYILIECIRLQKPFLWFCSSNSEEPTIHQIAFDELKKSYPELTSSIIYNISEAFTKDGLHINSDIADKLYPLKSNANTDLLSVVFNFKLGSADGLIKRQMRKHPGIFVGLKKLNQKLYQLKSFRKSTLYTLKEAIKKADLKVLKVHYTISGFFRKNGINLGKNAKVLYSYKNKYQGQRCFLVGNGPSLTTSDLELLQNEITFGCNRVYKLFSDTTWRPTYFCMIDALIAKYSAEELTENITCPMFTNISTMDLMNSKPENLIFARNLGEPEYRISNNFAGYYVPSGATVMTFMIELAMYMGFSEIYLIGVDCTSSLSSNGHCAAGYVNHDLVQKDIERVQKRLNDPTLTAEQVAAYYFDKSTFSYRVIKEYADEHKIHVYNATRGGMLEVFERKNLDSVLQE